MFLIIQVPACQHWCVIKPLQQTGDKPVSKTVMIMDHHTAWLGHHRLRCLYDFEYIRQHVDQRKACSWEYSPIPLAWSFQLSERVKCDCIVLCYWCYKTCCKIVYGNLFKMRTPLCAYTLWAQGRRYHSVVRPILPSASFGIPICFSLLFSNAM